MYLDVATFTKWVSTVSEHLCLNFTFQEDGIRQVLEEMRALFEQNHRDT